MQQKDLDYIGENLDVNFRVIANLNGNDRNFTTKISLFNKGNKAIEMVSKYLAQLLNYQIFILQYYLNDYLTKFSQSSFSLRLIYLNKFLNFNCNNTLNGFRDKINSKLLIIN